MKELDLGDIQTRGDVLRIRLTPILDVLVITNVKIEQYKDSGQDVPESLYPTRDVMYETALEVLKTEGKP